MKKSSWLVGVCVSSVLMGCGFVGESDKAQLEQAWLMQHKDIQQALESIRTQGLDVVAKTSAAGSVSACVADALTKSPVGALASVEGALADPAAITTLLNNLEKTLDGDVSLESLSGLWEQGADAAKYVKDLVSKFGLDQAMAQLQQMQEASVKLADTDLASHFQGLLLECEKTAN
ncbi:MAG: hypothetical protein ACRCT7_02075 [Shewanella sp.]